MDSAVPERRLAQANLLRVRGQWAEAKETLLGLLAERPNDRDTLDLLARTCEDAGEVEEARRWRGLAGAAPCPEPTLEVGEWPRLPSWALPAVLVFGLVVIALGFAIGRSSAAPKVLPVVDGRVEAPGTTASSVEPPVPPVTETTSGTIKPPEPIPAPTVAPRGETGAEARGLTRLIAAEGGTGRALAVSHDPRTDTATVTFSPRQGESPRREAATLARTAFGTFRTVRTLHMRALRGRDLVYLATSQRDRLAAVEADGWAAQNEANPDALADALLTEEWTAADPGDSNSTDAKWLGGP